MALLYILSLGVATAQEATIDLSSKKQTIRGFGGMNHPVWIGDLTESQIKTAYGNGNGQLGFSILRCWISDNSSQWSREVATAKKVQEMGGIVFATAWNPPSSMCENVSRNGRTEKRLKPSSYGDYVQHLNGFNNHLKENGVGLYAICFANEPDYGHDWTWYSKEEVYNFTKNYAGQLRINNTKVISAESFSYQKSYYDGILNDASAAANIDILGTHFYASNADSPNSFFQYSLADQKLGGKERWMTEHYTSSDATNDGSPRANVWPEALDVAYEIHRAFAVGNFNAYVWWYIRRHYGPILEDGSVSKRGWLMANYSKFVRPGFVRVDMPDNPTYNVYTSAYEKDGKIVIVAVNRSTVEKTFTINIPNCEVKTWERYVTSGTKNLKKESNITPDNTTSFVITLEPQSATTFTGDSSDNPTTDPSDQPADDAPDLSSMFSGVSLTKGPKGLDDHNTLISHRFGADPYAMVYNDEVYVYMTNDQQQFDNTNGDTNGYGEINTINCISSKDMVNWTDHGSMNIAGRNNSAGVAKWASCSWAPSAMHAKVNGKDKFFLYFANNGSGIGVVTSDTPYGPWVDPLGKELISGSTPNCGNVTWLFDPAVLMDDDGKAYLYFGGGVPDGKEADPGTARVVQLGSDYISIVGTPTTINPPYLFEDAGANKIGGKYIYSYCSNWKCVGNPMNNAEICYMTSDDPLGPFTYSGMVFKNHSAFFKNSGGNNHHAIFEFKGEYYIAYHALVLQNAMGLPDKGYRSTNIDKIPVDVATGKISQATGTLAGVPQICSHNPFVRTQGETMAWQGGINTRFGGDGMLLTSIDKGDWIGLSQVDFGSGASRFTACVSSNKTGAIKICLDEPDGEVVGYLEVPNTNGQLVEVSSKMLKTIKGEHHLFFVFTGGFELDYWVFDGSNANCTISATTIPMGDSISIKATASMEAEIDHIDMFANDSLLVHKYIAPYNWSFKPLETGDYTIKIVAYDKNGNVASDSANLFVCAAQAPYGQNKIPGVIEAEEFDYGCEEISYYDTDPQNEEGELRDDVSVDIVTGNNGYAIGYTMEGEWMNYTVDVTETATYELTATVASGIENSAFQIYVDGEKAGSEIIVPQTGTDVWDVYKEVKCDEIDLKAGKHVLRIEITSPYCNIDKLSFKSKSGSTGIIENGAIAGLSGKCDAFTPLGVYVKSFEIENGDISPIHDQLTEGIYLLRFENGKGLLIQVRKR